tara:strand:- start:173 stop:724 length:552 start_codon:yes stop_codon:yes gene_type:complete
MSAQDDSRENKQKKLFGFGGHKRGEKYDFILNGVKGELKTKKTGKNCSTKRRFTLETVALWKETDFIISEYDESNSKELTGVHYYLPAGSLSSWLEAQKVKLFEGSNKRLGYNDIDILKKNIDKEMTKEDLVKINQIFELCIKSVCLNCPTIPHSYIKKYGILLKEENFEKQKNYLKENKKIG